MIIPPADTDPETAHHDYTRVLATDNGSLLHEGIERRSVIAHSATELLPTAPTESGATTTRIRAISQHDRSLAPIVHENVDQAGSRTIDRCPPGICGAISTCRSSVTGIDVICRCPFRPSGVIVARDRQAGADWRGGESLSRALVSSRTRPRRAAALGQPSRYGR